MPCVFLSFLNGVRRNSGKNEMEWLEIKIKKIKNVGLINGNRLCGCYFEDENLFLRLSIEIFSAVFSSPNTLGNRLVCWGLV